MSTTFQPRCQRALAEAIRPGFGSLWQIVEEIDALRAEQVRQLATSNPVSRILIETALTVLEQKRGDCLIAIGLQIDDLRAAVDFLKDELLDEWEDDDEKRERLGAMEQELSDLIWGIF